jgi:hypothetical protein
MYFTSGMTDFNPNVLRKGKFLVLGKADRYIPGSTIEKFSGDIRSSYSFESPVIS